MKAGQGATTEGDWTTFVKKYRREMAAPETSRLLEGGLGQSPVPFEAEVNESNSLVRFNGRRIEAESFRRVFARDADIR